MVSDEELPHLLSGTNPGDRLPFTFYEAYNARDFDTIAEQYAEDVEFVDRRPGLTNVVQGRESQLEQMQVMFDLGTYQQPNVLLARRGKHLFLIQVVWTNRDDNALIEIDTLLLIEYNRDDKIVTVSVFEPNDLESAMTELEDRHIAAGGTS